MYHEITNPFAWPNEPYYDSVKEIPDSCRVHFPDGRTQDMSSSEMRVLANAEEWYVIVNDCNYGVCDHWISIPFSQWVNKYYPRIKQFVNKQKEPFGYCRIHQSVSLTKDKNFRKSEVWNS